VRLRPRGQLPRSDARDPFADQFQGGLHPSLPRDRGISDGPFCEDRGCSADTCDCGFFTGGSPLRKTLAPKGHVNPDEVAFLVLEPIQGVGGYRFPSEEFIAEVGDVCETHGIPVIVDEVQSGVGRTGEVRAIDHYPVEPDVIASAKALRVGATVSRSEIQSICSRLYLGHL